MEITPVNKPGSSLFHTIDRQFKSEVVVNFQFHPEPNNLIAGLVPFLKDCGHAYHLKMFTPEAIQRQVQSKWDAEKREAHSEADIELQNLLAKEDDLNFTDERTLEVEPLQTDGSQEPLVSVNVLDFPLDHLPSMRREDDSVSTFHHGNNTIITEDVEEDEEGDEDDVIEIIPKTHSPVNILRTSKNSDPDVMSRISTSDSASHISSIETEISTMNKAFREEIEKLQQQALSQAKSQNLHGSMLTKILDMLKQSNRSNVQSTLLPPEAANPPQASDAGDPIGVAGSG
jgi:hypothetical protein